MTALLLPVVAILPSALLDRGPDDSTRVSVFPLILALFDPFVWTSACNSVVVASLVAFGSLGVGVGLASIVESSKFWGRKPLWYLALAPLAAGPLVLAPGLNLSLGGPRSWDWLAARSILGFSLDNLVRWTSLAWVGLATGAPVVALSTAAALRRIEPAWLDAARATGASRWRIWREIVWPILRPDAARASAVVFVLSLIEPVGPLVFGLRRTLAVQILTAATRLDQPTRAAALALLAIVLSVLGRRLISWWGGPRYSRPEALVFLPPRSASLRRALLFRAILMAWVLLAVGPIVVLLLRTFSSSTSAAASPWASLVRPWLDDPDSLIWIANSASTAIFGLVLDLAILAALFRHRSVPISLIARLIEAVPPLTLGVGALAIPWLLDTMADLIGGATGRLLGHVSMELSPARSPGFLLILALAALKFPMLARVAELARGLARPVRIDASRLMGASDRQASRAGQGSWLGAVPALPALLALALAATNVAPAFLLTPFSERRTLSPAILETWLQGGALDPRLAGGMLLIFSVNLLGFALASRWRIGSLGDWFRGR